MSVPPQLRRIVRASVERLPYHQPAETAEQLAARLGMPVEHILKLDANENPYGCSIRVQEALAAYDRYQFFPGAGATTARERVASYAGTTAERVILGNGASELIDLLLQAVIDPGDEVLIPTPTFEAYSARAELFGARAVKVDRAPDYELNVDALLDAVTDRAKLIFVASPNNPTGNVASPQQIVRLLQTAVLVAVDEAYFEFSNRSVLPLIGEWDNLVVLRTFSTWAGLAGLRVGYGAFPRFLAEQMRKVKRPSSVSAAALTAAEASLDDVEHLYTTVGRIRRERERLFKRLNRIDYLTPYPSAANFILCRVTRGDAHEVALRLSDRGIMVRSYRDPQLRDCLRISIGRPEDSERLLTALTTIGALL